MQLVTNGMKSCVKSLHVFLLSVVAPCKSPVLMFTHSVTDTPQGSHGPMPDIALHLGLGHVEPTTSCSGPVNCEDEGMICVRMQQQWLLVT